MVSENSAQMSSTSNGFSLSFDHFYKSALKIYNVLYFLNFLLEYNCFYSVTLVSAGQRSESAMLTHITPLPVGPPSHPSPIPALQAITEHWAELPVLYSSVPLALCQHRAVYVCQS